MHHPMKPFALPTDWTAEQALAVVDLLDDLRERIWARYEVALLDAYRDRYAPAPADDDTESLNDPVPF